MELKSFDSLGEVLAAVKELNALLKKGGDSKKLRHSIANELRTDKCVIWSKEGKEIDEDLTAKLVNALYHGVAFPDGKMLVDGQYHTIGSILLVATEEFPADPLRPEHPMFGTIGRAFDDLSIDWEKQTDETRKFFTWFTKVYGGVVDRVLLRDLINGKKLAEKDIRVFHNSAWTDWKTAGKPDVSIKTRKMV